MRSNPALAGLGTYTIAELQQRVRAMREAGLDVIDFSIGDPREPTPAAVRASVRQAIPEVSQYPTVRGRADLRQAVAGYLERRCGVSVDPDTQIIPTSGSKEAIFSTPLAFVDRATEDAVVWPTPGYPIYQRGAILAGAVGRPVVLSGDFVFRTDMVPVGWWDEVRMVWICSPHNPAGSVMTRSDLREFHERTVSVGAILCSDECYLDLYDDQPPSSVLEVTGPAATNTLVFLSLSKRSGMTGYRSGAIVGDPELIAILASFRTSTGTASPDFVQAGAVAAWSDDAHVEERRRIFAAKRSVLRESFERLGYAVLGSTAGIYLWVRVGDDLAVTERLLAANIVVSPGRAFGPGGEGHIRLALVPTLADCGQAAEAVFECLSES